MRYRNHNICGECWFVKDHSWGTEIGTVDEVWGRFPHRVLNHSAVDCCYCKRSTTAGIFVRDQREDCCGEED